VSDLELAAVLALGLLVYRLVEALLAVRRADRHERAVRYRDTYGWPVEGTQRHISRSKLPTSTDGQRLHSRPFTQNMAKVGHGG
jgi:hypothetical protein